MSPADDITRRADLESGTMPASDIRPGDTVRHLRYVWPIRITGREIRQGYLWLTVDDGHGVNGSARFEPTDRVRLIRRTAEPGTVSHGTMRYPDLITAFMGLLRKVDPERAAQWAETERISLKAVDGTYAADPSTEAEVSAAEDDAVEWFQELESAMNDYAPEGHWFGAHPGDGSDYGFWPDEDADEDEDAGGIPPEAMAAEHRYVMGAVNAYCPACSVNGVTALTCDHDTSA